MPKVPLWVFIVLAIVYFTSVRVDVMDIDASQYAEIAREMMESGSYLQVYDKGVDYLDKPPFLFWVSALSMKVFGVNNFGYKFPSILFALWSLFATYRLARILYGENAGRMAALILGCCQGMFLWTNDIRTDTILMAWTITAIWLIKEWDVSGKIKYLLLGSGAIAFGMMTKGPVALMVPVFCLATDWALKREWRKFLKPEYLLCLAVIGILLVPMSIGLYQQFDQQPNKVIDGQTGVSGLKFFYWTQSFGRLTGENVWSNNAPFRFLFENMLWAFLPWILLFVAALILNIVGLFRQGFKLSEGQEWLTTGGFILAYVALGSSRYQLPHYIFIAFPLCAIMVAKLLKDFFEGKYGRFFSAMKVVQVLLGGLILIAALLTFVHVFEGSGWVYVAWAASVLVWLFVLLNHRVKGKILLGSAAAIIGANVILTNHFYYELLEYQAGSQLAEVINERKIPSAEIKSYKPEDALECMHFYVQHHVKLEYTTELLDTTQYVITAANGLGDLDKSGIKYDVLHKDGYFKVSELTPDFVNPQTRRNVLKDIYLLKLR